MTIRAKAFFEPAKIKLISSEVISSEVISSETNLNCMFLNFCENDLLKKILRIGRHMRPGFFKNFTVKSLDTIHKYVADNSL